ncbi:hypothetical protein NC652_024308 [Populus alba x Populus x berolinensis]|nr:hypothetical protein NC652_024308 [Populus alba x Populus x berolinensis]
MLVFYDVPAFLSGVASFVLYPNSTISGCSWSKQLSPYISSREPLSTRGVVLDSAILISSTTSSMIHGSVFNHKYPGSFAVLVGISVGNLYHHLLLASLRTKSEKEYKIPKGGYSLWNCDLRDLCQTKDVTCGSCAAVKREENDATSDKPYLLLKFTLVFSAIISLKRNLYIHTHLIAKVSQKLQRKKSEIQVSSRTATLIAYKLSFLASAVSLGLFPNEDLGFLFVESTLTLQFLQPVLT